MSTRNISPCLTSFAIPLSKYSRCSKTAVTITSTPRTRSASKQATRFEKSDSSSGATSFRPTEGNSGRRALGMQFKCRQVLERDFDGGRDATNEGDGGERLRLEG